MIEIRYDERFNPTTATRSEIQTRALRMRGRTLRELGVAVNSVRERSSSDKGLVGILVENYFRIRQNSESAPDFSGAGVELKVVPLKPGAGRKRSVRVKERTSVTMIDYAKLVEEEWASASVRKKLAAILFVYFVHEKVVTPETALDCRIADVVLWEPDTSTLGQLERDWTVVRSKTVDGRAHQISEGDGRLMGAATKDSKAKDVPQPRSAIPARRRAWALKAAFTNWILDSARERHEEISVAELLRLSPRQSFEQELIRRIDAFRGHELVDVAASLGIDLARNAKAAAAILIRRSLGLFDDDARIREFAQFGIEVKTVPVSADGTQVFESMSFPRFDHMKVIDETWETSDLRPHLERILIVPIVRRRRTEPLGRNRVGRVFFWTPSEDEMAGIAAEWEMFVDAIRRKEADRLPTAAETRYLHVRPKGRDGTDREPAPGHPSIMKRCFWLNASFVREVLAAKLPGGVL